MAPSRVVTTSTPKTIYVRLPTTLTTNRNRTRSSPTVDLVLNVEAALSQHSLASLTVSWISRHAICSPQTVHLAGNFTLLLHCMSLSTALASDNAYLFEDMDLDHSSHFRPLHVSARRPEPVVTTAYRAHSHWCDQSSHFGDY